MAYEAHRPSCARQLRQQALRQGQTVNEIAQLIHEHCLVSKLRAARMARGITLREAAAALTALGQQRPAGPRVDGDQLGHWETGRTPRAKASTLLCTFYQCSPTELGLSTAEAGAHDTAALPAHRLAPASSTGTPTSGASALDVLDDARRAVDRTLASGTVSPTQLDMLDEQILWARQQYVYTAPDPMLRVLLEHLGEVQNLAAQRQPAAVQVRLSELTAMLATLIADALMKMGHLVRSQSWYATARGAADDSGNRELRARVRAQAAMLPFYYGPLEAAVALAREARTLCRGRPGATAAFASAAEARALAKLGDAEGATNALRLAAAAFEHRGTAGLSDNDAWAFPERRLRLYESGTLTALGRTAQARAAQQAALRLYPTRTGIDPALLALEAAICFVHDRSPAEACQLAGATLLNVPPQHLTPIVRERAQEVINALPPGLHRQPAALQLRELLALPTGQM
ncbi:helix-turn-helix transcriptional regulator [Streptomyces sp. NPDC001941]|uniref:helix-turn-helix domain-containing protein n=1 Tax=Streptomyces sp. NPDC001941 TaxID=3154659 RepID=UPI00331F50D8